jgi:toxin ParE1/3/4
LRVRVSGPAASDVEAAFRFLNERNPRAARAVRSAIRNTIRSLRRMPNRGRVSVLPDLREIVVTGAPYVVIYAVEARAVTVMRVRHTSQDPQP